MVSTLARILDIDFKRIQFTPDLMPSDITGTNVLEEDENGRRNFRFVEGPIFTNILLADEINRTPPKTQAALLQAMQEREVYGRPDDLYACPSRSSPSPRRTRSSRKEPIRCPKPSSTASCSTSRSTIRPPKRKSGSWPRPRAAKGPRCARCSPAGRSSICRSWSARWRSASTSSSMSRGWCAPRGPRTPRRPPFVQELVDWGAGPRAGQFLIHGGKALAAMEGRFSVAIDDIRKVAVPVLRHRVSTNFQAQAEGMTQT